MMAYCYLLQYYMATYIFLFEYNKNKLKEIFVLFTPELSPRAELSQRYTGVMVCFFPPSETPPGGNMAQEIYPPGGILSQDNIPPSGPRFPQPHCCYKRMATQDNYHHDETTVTMAASLLL